MPRHRNVEPVVHIDWYVGDGWEMGVEEEIGFNKKAELP